MRRSLSHPHEIPGWETVRVVNRRPPPRHVPVDTALAAWNADSEASRAIRSLMQDGGDSSNPREGV